MQASAHVFKNPIKSGFYPDPSICRVGEDYYLVTSTFAYFPGVPIFHSKDLVHWRQIGHVLTRASQLPLEGAGTSQGIFAPTLRFNAGVFYMITTNVTKGGNFFVTATNPSGPWSDPVLLPDAPGIDPTIFFDDDGSAWYLGTRPAPEGPKYSGNWEVWLQALDLKNGKLTGEPVGLWRGALRDAIWPEGPHLYKRGNYYYLMIAEGGTGPNHAVCMARSERLTGPYVGNPNNPILTHRHLGAAYPVAYVGHADIVETASGETWMVALATRPYGGGFRNLGRETFLLPATWEDDWLVPVPGSGIVPMECAAPNLPWTPWPQASKCDHFDAAALRDAWCYLRNPRLENYSLSARPGWLTLRLAKESLFEQASPSAVFRRQEHMDFLATTRMEFKPRKEGECAGLVIRQNEKFQYVFALTLYEGQRSLHLVKIEDGARTVIARAVCPDAPVNLALEARGQDLFFRWSMDGQAWNEMASAQDGRLLSTDRAGGFVGTMLGLVATANGQESDNSAAFDWFEYSGIAD
jgi:alpha-N-arabinofuranosidase